jgi:hypothetical protein
MQVSRRDLVAGFGVLLAGLAVQAIWLYAVPFAWGWDSTANLAIGRMYFGLPYEMWDVKFYYPPAYPIFLTLMGVHHLNTLAYLKIGTLFVGGLMPLFLFLMMRPFDSAAALFAALVFAASFGNAFLSTDMMNHHFHAFQLLFMSMLLAWYLYRPSIPMAVLLGVAAALANAGRQVTAFIFFSGVAILALANWVEQRNVLAVAKGAIVLTLSFVGTVGALSLARQAALGGPFQFGLTYDVGVRTMFIGTYYGPSIYQKEFHPGEDYVFMRPENGPASKELFERMRAYFEKADVKNTGLSETNDKDEALRNLITQPTQGNGYLIWWGLGASLSPEEGDRLQRRVLIETIISQPRILRYHVWNFWSFLFGPPMIPNASCVKCVCPPCFSANLPELQLGGFMGAAVFHKVASLDVVAQMASEYERAKSTAPYAQFLYTDVRQIFVVKPLLTILLFASIFLARGKTRFLMLYCAAAVLIIGATSALAWPVQARYQYPVIPYVLAGASISIFEIIRRIRGFTGVRFARSEPAR